MKCALVAAVLLGSTLVLAQNNPPPGPNGQNGQQGGGQQGGQGQQQPQRFEEVKAKHLEHIAKHIAELQKAQSCVQAATNHDSLRACRPPERQQ